MVRSLMFSPGGQLGRHAICPVFCVMHILDADLLAMARTLGRLEGNRIRVQVRGGGAVVSGGQ